jgi:hypothetical protein
VLPSVRTFFCHSRMYKWKKIDSTDYSSVIQACMGRRESDIMTMCYEPRHAAVFLDDVGKIVGIYEICFECGSGKLAFDNIDFISMNGADYKILKSLFDKYKFFKRKKKKKRQK